MHACAVVQAPPAPDGGVVLFSRWSEGSVPIKMTGAGRDRRFEIATPGGQTQQFDSARRMLKALRGGRDPHWTLDRYLRQGKYAPPPIPEPAIPLFDLLAEPDFVIDVPVLGEQAIAITATEMAILTSKKTTPEVVLGVDLAKRGHEVAKLLYAGFGSLIFASGYDPEEVLQEVYRGLLARNAGRCAFDPRKASFGHYVHMVCSCVLKNWHRREHRYRQMEQVGLPTWDRGDRTTDDVGTLAVTRDPDALAGRPSIFQSEDAAANDLTAYILGHSPVADARVAINLLPLVRQGLGRSEIAAKTGLPKPVISRALTHLREATRRWMQARE